MTAASASAFEPDPSENVAQGIAEMENFLATQVPASPAKTPQRGSEEFDFQPTKRVLERRDEVLEARQLLQWQEDDAPHRVETNKVRKLKGKVKEAAALRKLDDDPDMVAWRDLKAQKLAIRACMAGVVIALLVSSAGVQHSVVDALNATEHGLVWWLAFLVEPAMSMPLLAVVGAKAYSAIRGRVIDRESHEAKTMLITEMALLVFTLVLNCWPALVWKNFSPLELVVHSLGPVVAVLSVWVLPSVSRVFAQLHKPEPEAKTQPETAGVTEGVTPQSYSENTKPIGGFHRRRVRFLIDNDALPKQPSANQIQKATGCGMDVAREIRDELKGGQA